MSFFFVQSLACFVEDFAGSVVDDVFGESLSGDTGGDGHLLVELISSDSFDVVSLGIKEVCGNQIHGGGVLDRLAGTKLSVDFSERLEGRIGSSLLCVLCHFVFFDSGSDSVVIAENGDDIGKRINFRSRYAVTALGNESEGSDEQCHGDFAGLIDSDPHNIVAVYFVFKPCTAVRNYLCGIDALTCLVNVGGKVHSGGTDNLGYDYAFCSVDNESAVLGHEREIAHKDIGFLYLGRQSVCKSDFDTKRSSIVYVSLFAFFNREGGILVNRVRDVLDGKIL